MLHVDCRDNLRASTIQERVHRLLEGTPIVTHLIAAEREQDPAMLSDADITKLMEESRRRSPSKMLRSLDGADRETARDTGALPTELQEIIGILDGTLLKPPPPEALILRKSLKPLPPIPEL